MFRVEDARITLGSRDCANELVRLHLAYVVLVNSLKWTTGDFTDELVYMRTAVYKNHLFRTKLMR